jgi:glycine/D-amino acid oxidase-like deaminating enzyme
VIAVNAWAASSLREFSGSLVVVASDCIATPPIGDRLAEVGWDSGVTLVDSHRLLNYMRRTDEGRVVFGKAGGTLAFGGRVNTSFHGESPRAAEVESHFRRLFPALADVPVAVSWRGPIDYSIVGLPSVTNVGGRRDVIAVAGFSGNGVAPSHVTARIIASLLQERDDEWANAGLVGPPRGGLPPEPFRYAGGRIVRAAIARKERIEDTGRRPSRVIRAVAKLDPTSFADLGDKK